MEDVLVCFAGFVEVLGVFFETTEVVGEGYEHVVCFCGGRVFFFGEFDGVGPGGLVEELGGGEVSLCVL